MKFENNFKKNLKKRQKYSISFLLDRTIIVEKVNRKEFI